MLNLLKSTDFINTPHVLATQIYKIYKFTATDDDRKNVLSLLLTTEDST